jgi:ABC-type transport system involved in multi-copper enzyme maturation permease subunit
MGWMLVLSMAISTAGSFRRERESGVLELLLVSPIGERTIISGRLRGLWNQFLPAFGLLLIVWAYLSSISLTGGADGGSIVFYTVTFFSLPVIGLYYSLRCRAFMGALLAAMGAGFVIPLIVGSIMAVWWSIFVAQGHPSVDINGTQWYIAPVQACIATVCWKRLYRRLKTRSFPLDRASL